MTLRALLILLAVASASVVAPSASQAQEGPLGAVDARIVDAAGDPEHRAGVAPDRLLLDLDLDLSAGNMKDLTFELPPGFVGNPTAVPTCPRWMISALSSAVCPSDTQVGVVNIEALGAHSLGLYNLEPDPGYVAEFGFKSFLLDSRMFIKALPNGQAQFELHDSAQSGIDNLEVEMWGVPADHQTAPTAPRRTFLSTATHCDGVPPALSLRATTWQAPATTQALRVEIGPPLVGCEDLEFDSRLGFAIDDSRTDSPTGVQLTLAVPQNDPAGEQVARVKDVRIDFPSGLTLSPGAANGLTACREEAVGLGQPGPTSCPASARIGTVEMTSPLLRDPVAGTIYIGRQRAETLYSMYVVVSDRGLELKLPGTLHADSETGRLHAEILDMPEVPFDRLTMSIGGGSRALIVTSLTCGSGTGSATLTPYNGGPPSLSTASVATTADPFGRPCPVGQPFTPTFVAGTSRPRAGAAGPFAVTIRRDSGEQLMDRFAMTLPAGLSARLASVARCAAVAATAGACPPSSRIGAAITETGSGASPFALEGDAFLTGPYRRAPFGLALVFRAVAGPFDLGSVVIRAALRIDPLTGQVTVETDRLPRIVRGVPLRIQTIALDIDRPGFITNPTSCVPSAVTATIVSADGAAARSRSRFAVGGCRSLRFRPTLSMALTDRSELRADGHPGMRLRLRTYPRDANLRDIGLELPKLLQGSFTGPRAICSRTQLEDERCPADSKIGTVSGRTPLLSKPLRGSIHMVQPPGNGIADIWAVMKSTGVHVRFRMKNSLKDGRVNGKLVNLPDIPLSSLTLTFAGGKHAMFRVTRDPCAQGRPRRMLTKTRLTAHNAARRAASTRIAVAPGC